MQGRLIPTMQVEADMATLAKDLVRFLEILPDVLERDAGLNPEQIDRMHEEIDQARQKLYETIVARDAEPQALADA
jgi:Protein of unknown function (DUF1441)